MNKLRGRIASLTAPEIFMAGTALFVLLYIWANFFNRHLFNVDMYTDAQMAELMWQQGTLFPDGWIFGNQYYVVATPVLAALIYGVCGDSVLSIGVASTLMTFAQLLLFVWMIKPFVKRLSLYAGLFAFGGGAILGTSVCLCTTGMQLLYSMASYYSCYMIGILLVLGVYLRLSGDRAVGPLPVAFSLLMCLGLGVQSLRETLVLTIPLVIADALCKLLTRRSLFCKSSYYAAAAAGANCVGLYLMRRVPAITNRSISSFDIPSSFPEILENMKSAFLDLLDFTGLQFFSYGIKWLPLAVVSVFIVLASLYAVLRALAVTVRRGHGGETVSPVDFLLLFCAVSLFGVFFVGAFLGFKIRSIYYFVWLLLASAAFVSLLENARSVAVRQSAALLLLGCGLINLFYNAYPDLAQHREQQSLIQGAAQKLIAEGVDLTYVDCMTYFSSAIAASSHGQIESATVRIADGGDGHYCLKSWPALVKTAYFTDRDRYNSVVVLSDSRLSGVSTFDAFNASPGSEEDILSKLELMYVESNQYNDFYIYRILDPSVLGEGFD